MDFHPYAESFPILVGNAYESFKEDIAENGILEPIRFRFVGEVKQGLDGRNRLRACEELVIDCPELLVEIPDENVPAFIDSLNVHRRHLTIEQQQEKRSARVKRVAEKRSQGQSTREIAKSEGVSQSTIQSDLKKSTEQGCSVDPPDGKVTGKDGRKKPAKTKKLCASCEHRAEVGKPKIDKCPDCKALNAKPPKAKQPEPGEEAEPEADDIVVDDDEVAVPAALRSVFSQTHLFRSAAAMCAKTAIALDKVERSLAYALTDKQAAKSQGDRRVYSTVCRTAEKKMIGLRPAKVCCNEKACKACGGKGFLTHDEVSK